MNAFNPWSRMERRKTCEKSPPMQNAEISEKQQLQAKNRELRKEIKELKKKKSALKTLLSDLPLRGSKTASCKQQAKTFIKKSGNVSSSTVPLAVLSPVGKDQVEPISHELHEHCDFAEKPYVPRGK